MNMGLKRGFSKQMKKRIEGYEFEVGALEDKPHKQPVEVEFGKEPELRSYAGGPVRKISTVPSGISVAGVLIQNSERLGFDLLLKPFQDKSSDLMKFTSTFLKTAMAKGSMKRVENLLQAVVRNPILRGDYGTNSPRTADNKGFDRFLFDTGQMFKAIKARAKRV